MKVIIVGYGKMGREIEKILIERGHEVVSKSCSKYPLNEELIKDVDVAIEFSTPHVVLNNLNFLMKYNVPTIVGTTGWNDNYEEVVEWVENNNGSMVHASNFSIGVNLFFQLNEQLAKIMKPHTEYKAKITEIHHTEKLDAPSGTAITLAEGLLKSNSQLTDWYCPQSNKQKQGDTSLEIEAVREEDVKGTHTIQYTSDIDKISIQHEAFNRKGFALGAVIAAEWLIGKKGIFTMKDVLQLS